jgi:glycosyltransferase involved in cell wall biosynthesis
MKILYATYPWAFEVPGGGEQQLLQYERTLRKQGYEIARHNPWNSNVANSDIVHFFSCMGGSSHFCNFVKSQGRPLVVSASLWLTEETLQLYPIEEIRHQLLMADAIVTNGDIESRQIQNLLHLEHKRFVTVRNGFDTVFAKPVKPDLFREHFDISGPFLLNVGNIEPRKNQLLLALAARSMQLPLVILGHIRDKAYANAVLEAGGSGLRYLGPVDHHSLILRSAYAACAAFCLPSTLETPGLAALEAAAAGARIVITCEGSTNEYFSDLVHYVKHDDEQNISAQIDYALRAPHGNELAKRVISHFTWDHAVHPLAELYQSLIAPGKHHDQ